MIAIHSVKEFNNPFFYNQDISCKCCNATCWANAYGVSKPRYL